ncbi:MAG: hypothetical protein JWO40_719 [Candidatus Doudnabacteria bacterium]|nr:hypothetical protein [Candidatus Doudnabacteria bacterium]
MADPYDQLDADADTCAICGRHLSATNRSVTQPDLCKECAGEDDDVIAEFK